MFAFHEHAMMMRPVTELLKPLNGYIPTSKFGHRVVGPPSATLNADQKKEAAGDPLSFRYTAGRKAGCSTEDAISWISNLQSEAALLAIGHAVVVYRQEKGDFSATGVLGDLSVEAYELGRVKRHEKTIAKTQRKMAEYMATTRIFGNPAVTAFRPAAHVDEAIAIHTDPRPTSAFTTVDGINHMLWVVDGDAADELCGLFASDLYITDGHHRLAAAALVAEREGLVDARIPVGVFSAGEFRLRSFARTVTDPDLKVVEAIAKLGAEFEMDEVAVSETSPRSRFELGAKIGDRYFRIKIPNQRIPDDHYSSLNTNLIQELVLGPVFGITNPRLDKRLRFVANLGDIRETCASADAWLLPFPLEVSDVMAVADSDRTMPAKSTWFAPKLPSGLLIRPIDRA